MTGRRYPKTAGFTLIEIMVAMTILVVVVAGVYVCFSSVADTADVARAASEELRVKQFLWNNLRDNLNAISAQTRGEYALVGEDESGTYGDADTLRFASTLPMAGARSLPGQVKTVEYYIDDPGQSEGGMFETFDTPEAEEKDGTTLYISEKPLVLVGGGEDDLFPAQQVSEEDDAGLWEREVPIQSINFQYYDGGTEEWVDDWNSDETGLLPWAIKVQVNFAKTEEQKYADAAAGVDPREDFDLEMVLVLPTGAGTLDEFIDPNHYRLTDQEAEKAGESGDNS